MTSLKDNADFWKNLVFILFGFNMSKYIASIGGGRVFWDAHPFFGFLFCSGSLAALCLAFYASWKLIKILWVWGLNEG